MKKILFLFLLAAGFFCSAQENILNPDDVIGEKIDVEESASVSAAEVAAPSADESAPSNDVPVSSIEVPAPSAEVPPVTEKTESSAAETLSESVDSEPDYDSPSSKSYDTTSVESRRPDTNYVDEGNIDHIIEAYKNSVSGGEEKTEKKYNKPKAVAPKRAPKTYVSEKNYDKSDNYINESYDKLKYGLEEEIIKFLDELIKSEDKYFVTHIYDLFGETRNPVIRNKVIEYFSKIKDPCLGDYACEVINDPYDYKLDTVNACFRYVVAAEISECVPGLVDLVDKEEEEYFNGALTALGDLGSIDEAVFLSDYLDRDDLSVAQRQALMKVLGRIKAVETWDKLSEIAKDEDENSFVRMYAAEAIGAMEKAESEPILIELFESKDPNLRVYVLKGLSHFKTKESNKIIIQALRDSQYKVRLEAVEIAGERKMKESVPYLVYRCKDKEEEKVVKEKCYKVLAKMNNDEGNKYLISVIEDKKAGDNAKAKVAAALLEEKTTGIKEICSLAESTLENDIRKSLRFALGKEFAKYGYSELEGICEKYLDHEDVTTQGTGLDIWAKGRYSSLKSKVQEIAKDAEEDPEEENKEKPKTYQFGKKKKNPNAKKAKKILDDIK